MEKDFNTYKEGLDLEATPLRHRPVDGEDGREDTEELVQDGL